MIISDRNKQSDRHKSGPLRSKIERAVCFLSDRFLSEDNSGADAKVVLPLSFDAGRIVIDLDDADVDTLTGAHIQSAANHT